MARKVIDEKDTTEITIKRTKLYPTPGRTYRFQWVWYYECEGPDGCQFNNRSIAELRHVLRRHYGNGVRIIEPWKKPRTH